MKKKHVLTLLLMILIPIVFIQLRDAFDFEGLKNKKRCQQKDRAMKATVSGELVNKYEDSKNHNIRTLELKDNEGKKLISTILDADVSGLYEKLQVGDRLYKEPSRLMVIYENHIRKDSIALEFDCEQ